jgi:hypothetical protein
MMMGLGFFVMLAVLAVPILLIVGLLILMLRPLATRGEPFAEPIVTPNSGKKRLGVCRSCGARLQADWVHCPQCGAPADE